MFDEEVIATEQDFSDDEKEAEAKKQRKMQRQRKKDRPGMNSSDSDVEDGEIKEKRNNSNRGNMRGSGRGNNRASKDFLSDRGGPKRFRRGGVTQMPVYSTNQSVLQHQPESFQPFHNEVNRMQAMIHQQQHQHGLNQPAYAYA